MGGIDFLEPYCIGCPFLCYVCPGNERGREGGLGTYSKGSISKTLKNSTPVY